MKDVREIELRSDTMTKPTMAMREAMFKCVVGDDGYGEDPTVNELEELGARVFGKESCMFFPTGLMGNLAAIMAHCPLRGSEIIVGDECHIQIYEQGGVSTLGGIHPRSVKNLPDGTFDLAEVSRKIRKANNVHYPTTSLICIEDTHNRCGGAALPLNFIHDVSGICRTNNLPLHMDGARVFNAAVALGVPVDQVVKQCDSVSVCLSKGLACPVGTLVTGSAEFMKKVERCRKALGGSMRQAGVIAAPGIIALNTMIHRLAEDHTHARIIAEAVNSAMSDTVTVDMKRVQTNMVLFKLNSETTTARQFCQRMRQITEAEKSVLGEEDCAIVRMSPFGSDVEVVRVVTHNDLSLEDIQLAIKKLKYVMDEFDDKRYGSSRVIFTDHLPSKTNSSGYGSDSNNNNNNGTTKNGYHWIH